MTMGNRHVEIADESRDSNVEEAILSSLTIARQAQYRRGER